MPMVILFKVHTALDIATAGVIGFNMYYHQLEKSYKQKLGL
jgi:hypothetical protein